MNKFNIKEKMGLNTLGESSCIHINKILYTCKLLLQPVTATTSSRLTMCRFLTTHSIHAPHEQPIVNSVGTMHHWSTVATSVPQSSKCFVK